MSSVQDSTQVDIRRRINGVAVKVTVKVVALIQRQLWKWLAKPRSNQSLILVHCRSRCTRRASRPSAVLYLTRKENAYDVLSCRVSATRCREPDTAECRSLADAADVRFELFACTIDYYYQPSQPLPRCPLILLMHLSPLELLVVWIRSGHCFTLVLCIRSNLYCRMYVL